MPCTVRFNNADGEKERSYDAQVNRDKRLNQKNIKLLLSLDSFLLTKADVSDMEPQVDMSRSYIQ